MDSEDNENDCTYLSSCSVVCDDKSPCFSLYIKNNSVSNKPKLHTSGCWHQDETDVVLEKECYLKHQTTKLGLSSYICFCTGDLCNANVIFNDTLMAVQPTNKPKTS